MSFFWSKDLIILAISSAQNSKDESLSLVSKLVFTGTVPSLDIGVHCLSKRLMNRFPLSKKSVTSLLSTSSGGISGILLVFTYVFKMTNKWWYQWNLTGIYICFQDDQYVFGAVFGSFRLLVIRSSYFNLEELVAFDISSVRAFKGV